MKLPDRTHSIIIGAIYKAIHESGYGIAGTMSAIDPKNGYINLDVYKANEIVAKAIKRIEEIDTTR